MSPHTTCLICFDRWAYAADVGICASCRARLHPFKVTNVLGETRQAPNVYLDGAFTCPFCWSAAGLAEDAERSYDPIPRDRCPNPCCSANPRATSEYELERRRLRAEARAREDDFRRRSDAMAESSRRYHEQRDAEIREARESGYCVQCFIRSGNRKRIRHRRANYHTAS